MKESESNPCPHRLDKGINSPVEGKVVEIPHDLQGFSTIPGAGVQKFLSHQQYVTILPAFYMLILNFDILHLTHCDLFPFLTPSFLASTGLDLGASLHWDNSPRKVIQRLFTLPPIIMEVENGALEDEFGLEWGIFHFHD